MTNIYLVHMLMLNINLQDSEPVIICFTEFDRHLILEKISIVIILVTNTMYVPI